MQLLTQPIGRAPELLQQAFLHPASLTQHEELRRTDVHRAKAGQIGAQCVCESQCITPIIFGARDRATLTKAGELLGVERKDLEPSLDQHVHDGAVGRLNRYGDLGRLSGTEVTSPGGELGQTHTIMLHLALAHATACAVEDVHLVHLAAPINADKPLRRKSSVRVARGDISHDTLLRELVACRGL